MRITMRLTILFPAVLLCGALAATAQDSAVQTLKPMAKNADPAFEVAAIERSDPNDRNSGFHLDGRRIFIENMPMRSLVCFAYSIQRSQIVNAPAWFNEQLWDIRGVPDVEGVPDQRQQRRMVEKVLAERFGLVAHREMREMAVYTLTVAKAGPKMETSKSAPNAPIDQSGDGRGVIRYTNNSMADFAVSLQFTVGKPVLDKTKLSGRYNFTLRWTPDEVATPDPNAPPGLFTALEDELGLKLEAARAPADVVVIDAVTRPTQN
jgi:uncharacterized protein (TIGR03435 family)